MKSDAGLHIIIDGFVNDSCVFDKDNLHSLFEKLAEELKMKIILGPSFLEVDLDPSKLNSEIFEDEGGITGMCVISTSHMSIHCWPLRKCFSMDVFSCKNFDCFIAIETIKQFLNLKEFNVINVNRQFP